MLLWQVDVAEAFALELFVLASAHLLRVLVLDCPLAVGRFRRVAKEVVVEHVRKGPLPSRVRGRRKRRSRGAVTRGLFRFDREFPPLFQGDGELLSISPAIGMVAPCPVLPVFLALDVKEPKERIHGDAVRHLTSSFL